MYYNRLDHKNQNLVDDFPIVLSKYKKRETIPLGNPHFSGSMRQHTFFAIPILYSHECTAKKCQAAPDLETLRRGREGSLGCPSPSFVEISGSQA